MMADPAKGGAVARRFLAVGAAGATLAFLALIAPFAGAILWAVIAAVIFAPLNTRVLRAMPRRRSSAALVSLLIIIIAVVVPAMLLAAALVQQATAAYAQILAGQIDLGRLFTAIQAQLPAWARPWLADLGLGDLGGLRAMLAQGLAGSARVAAGQALTIGQGTLGFVLSFGVMLYLTFFLLRDGRPLAVRIERAIPLTADQRDMLAAKFVAVIRATIKGSLIVAILQGATGGLVFWAIGLPGALLWGVAMGVFSLFPAVGTGLIWVPVTIYLLASGSIWQAVTLGLCGCFIIGSVDNIVRPILVGRDARMPDYVVLIATLGGFELIGFNGFVIGPVIAALFMAVWELIDQAGPTAARSAHSGSASAG